jgi:hypothetical protein
MIESAIVSQFLEGEASEADRLAAVTPPVATAAPLRDSELAIINVFERSTRGVVNIFDLSLQGRAAPAQADAPEGNGSGFVWSRQGHIVSNYHVLGNILRGLGPNAAQRGDVKVRPGPLKEILCFLLFLLETLASGAGMGCIVNVDYILGNVLWGLGLSLPCYQGVWGLIKSHTCRWQE